MGMWARAWRITQDSRGQCQALSPYPDGNVWMSDRSALLRKYPLSGPRYTSYPTVPSWTTSPSAEQWLTGLVDTLRGSTRAQGSGLSLYVHIPFCESLCTFCGCNTRITRNYGVGLPYVQTVLQEWAIYRERFCEAGWGEGMLPS